MGQSGMRGLSAKWFSSGRIRCSLQPRPRLHARLRSTGVALIPLKLPSCEGAAALLQLWCNPRQPCEFRNFALPNRPPQRATIRFVQSSFAPCTVLFPAESKSAIVPFALFAPPRISVGGPPLKRDLGWLSPRCGPRTGKRPPFQICPPPPDASAAGQHRYGAGGKEGRYQCPLLRRQPPS